MDRGAGGTATLIARPVGELDDQALVAQVRDGDDGAFEVLYDRYLRRITAYVKGMVYDHGRAEDVTQEVFISALRRMRETERPIAFKPWIYEIARNACIDQYRRSKHAEEVSYDSDHALGSSDRLRLVTAEATPDAAVDTKQQLDHLCGAFGGLSQSHHEILVLRELEGMSYREIGDRMSLSRAAVESTLFRARRRLSEEYEDLISGRRCERVQAIIDAAAEGMLGERDRRRLARHVSYCQVCRHHAHRLGVHDAKPARRVGSRLAALLPIPSFLRFGRGGPVAVGGGPSNHASGTLAQWTASIAPAVEPVTAGWTKAVATVVTLGALGMGAGVSSHSGAITRLSHAPSHRTSLGAPGSVGGVMESRPSTVTALGARPGSELASAAAPISLMAVSTPARRGENRSEAIRARGRRSSGVLPSTLPEAPAGGAVTGPHRVAVPGTPVGLHAQARGVSAPERKASTPEGISEVTSTPVGVVQVGASAPDLTPPAVLPVAISTGAGVVGSSGPVGASIGD